MTKHTHLPHVDIEGYYQFITFRTFDSVDEYIKNLSNKNQSNKIKQQKIDDYLDNSQNGAYLNGEVLDFLYQFLKSKDGSLYELVAFAIMDNHIHLLIKPLQNLSKIVQYIKGGSAKIINQMLGKSGKFWADDYYDKAIRDEKHFGVVYEYIENNPLKILIGTDIGSGTLVPHKINLKGEVKTSLPKYGTDTGSGTLVPQIYGADTSVSDKRKSEVKTSLPKINRFYGKYE